MGKLVRGALLALSLALLALGLLVADERAVGATNIHYELRVNPSGSSTLDSLTCGWHQGGCSSRVVGDALDWDNEDYAAVYRRSFASCSQACLLFANGLVQFDPVLHGNGGIPL